VPLIEFTRLNCNGLQRSDTNGAEEGRTPLVMNPGRKTRQENGISNRRF